MSISTSQSHTCSSSLRSWDDTRTVRPVPARRADRATASPARPAGRARWPARRGSAARGRRAARRRCRAAASCRASSCGSGRRPRPPRPTVLEQGRDPSAVVAADGGEHPEVLGAGQRRVEGRALDERADVAAGRRRGRRSTRPSTVPVPAVGRTRPSSMAMVVVLPAPLGPTKPATTPGGSSMSRWSTTVRCAVALGESGDGQGGGWSWPHRRGVGPRPSSGRGRLVGYARCGRPASQRCQPGRTRPVS